jgi:chorismate mutase
MTDKIDEKKLNEYKAFCKANVDKLPYANKTQLVLQILDSSVEEKVLEDAIPDLTKKNPASDGIRIFMDKLPDYLILEIYKSISSCLKYTTDNG